MMDTLKYFLKLSVLYTVIAVVIFSIVLFSYAWINDLDNYSGYCPEFSLFSKSSNYSCKFSVYFIERFWWLWLPVAMWGQYIFYGWLGVSLVLTAVHYVKSKKVLS